MCEFKFHWITSLTKEKALDKACWLLLIKTEFKQHLGWKKDSRLGCLLLTTILFTLHMFSRVKNNYFSMIGWKNGKFLNYVIGLN